MNAVHSPAARSAGSSSGSAGESGHRDRAVGGDGVIGRGPDQHPFVAHGLSADSGRVLDGEAEQDVQLARGQQVDPSGHADLGELDRDPWVLTAQAADDERAGLDAAG